MQESARKRQLSLVAATSFRVSCFPSQLLPPGSAIYFTLYLQARTKILLAVSKVKVCNLDQIRQMGNVYNEMTGKPEEVSEDAQVGA